MDLKELYWIGTTTGDRLAILILDWDDPETPGGQALSEPRHFYESVQ
jgi:hypothetical protein